MYKSQSKLILKSHFLKLKLTGFSDLEWFSLFASELSEEKFWPPLPPEVESHVGYWSLCLESDEL